MAEHPKDGEKGIAEDRETGAEIMTSDHPMYATFLQLLNQERGTGQASAAREFSGKLLGSRKVLSMDELLEGRNHRMRFEQHFPEAAAWFYTVDLVLRGDTLRGALLAGSCALIFATSRRAADELAAAGLQTTLEAGFDYANGPIDRAVISAELEFGGRKGDPTPVNPDTLHTDVRMREKIITTMESKPKRWKH